MWRVTGGLTFRSSPSSLARPAILRVISRGERYVRVVVRPDDRVSSRLRGATSPRTAVSRVHCSHPSVTAQRSRRAAFYYTAPIHERVSNPLRALLTVVRLRPPVFANLAFDIREREHVMSTAWNLSRTYPRRSSIASAALIRRNVIMGVGGAGVLLTLLTRRRCICGARKRFCRGEYMPLVPSSNSLFSISRVE